MVNRSRRSGAVSRPRRWVSCFAVTLTSVSGAAWAQDGGGLEVVHQDFGGFSASAAGYRKVHETEWVWTDDYDPFDGPGRASSGSSASRAFGDGSASVTHAFADSGGSWTITGSGRAEGSASVSYIDGAVESYASGDGRSGYAFEFVTDRAYEFTLDASVTGGSRRQQVFSSYLTEAVGTFYFGIGPELDGSLPSSYSLSTDEGPTSLSLTRVLPAGFYALRADARALASVSKAGLNFDDLAAAFAFSLTLRPIEGFVWTGPDEGPTLDGNFGVGDNWLTDDVPVKNEDRADTAIFNAAGNYTVDVGTQHTDRLLVRGGNVTFTGADYRVDALSPDDPSLLIDGGTLTLVDGQLRTNHAVVGDGATAASLTVSGETAQFVGDARLTLGRGDRGGVLVVEDGGYARSLESRISDSGSFGEWSEAVVHGDGSLWDSGALSVGYRGWGQMRVEDGGQVESSVASIGTEAGALGSVTVTGRASALAASSWDVKGDLTVGQAGAGRLGVLDGGSVHAEQVIIGGEALGGDPGGLGGTALVSGRWEGALDSLLTADTSLVIGQGSPGRLEVSDGGYAGNPTVDTNLWIYVGAGEKGEVEVARGGALVGDRLDVGISSDGRLHVLEGGQVRVNELYVGGIGLFEEARGEVLVAGALADDPTERSRLTVADDAVVGNAGGGGGSLQLIGGVVDVGGELWVGPKGAVSGVGTLRTGSRTVLAGGTIAPGLSPGTLAFDGDFVIESGTLVVEFAGLFDGGHDLIEVTGDAQLGGDLIIQLLDGFVPEAGDELRFLDVAGDIVGAFASVTFEGAGPGLDWEFLIDEDGFGIRALSDAAAAIPTPAALPAGLALVALALARRR